MEVTYSRANIVLIIKSYHFLGLQTFFRPVHSYSLEHGGLDSIARGLANLPCQSYDQFFTKQISNHLFTERPPFGPSMDLLSLNIQRGRDHGIGSKYGT
jgi:peroxidase